MKITVIKWHLEVVSGGQGDFVGTIVMLPGLQAIQNVLLVMANWYILNQVNFGAPSGLCVNIPRTRDTESLNVWG